MSWIEKFQGLMARSVDALPSQIHEWLAQQRHETFYQHLDPTLKSIFWVRRFRNKKPTLALDPQQARLHFKKETEAITPIKTPIWNIEHLTLNGADGPLRARLYTPYGLPIEHQQNQNLIVFFHGGGFCMGDIDTHDEPCRVIATKTGAKVLSVNYRLAPEFSFPSGFLDCLTAYKWIMRQSHQFNVNSKHIWLCGDSAGASLALALTLYLSRTHLRPAGQLLFYPAVDYHLPTESKQLFGNGLMLTQADVDAVYLRYNPLGLFPRHDPRLSPLSSPNFRFCPPTFIVTAEFDVLRDEAEILGSRLIASGVPVQLERMPSVTHGFLSMTSIHRASRYASWQTLYQCKQFMLKHQP